MLDMAPSVLTNDDLLHEIFQYCEKPGIASVRLCCRQFEVIGSHYLFRSLTMGFRKRYIRRARRIAGRDKFSRGVRELVWETASYQNQNMRYSTQQLLDCVDSVAILRDGGLKDPFPGLAAATARMNSLATDEANLCDAPSFFNDVKDTLEAFTGLHRVILTSWRRDDMQLFNVEALLGKEDLMPPPFETSTNRHDTSRNQTRSTLIILLLLQRAGRTINSLEILPTPNTVLGIEGAKNFTFPGFNFHFNWYPSHPERFDETMRSLRNLRKLHLDIGDQNVADRAQMQQLGHDLEGGGAVRFLANLPKLESLHIRLNSVAFVADWISYTAVTIRDVFGSNIFPCLRHLHLESMWLESSDEPCILLGAHSCTLNTLELSNINIGGARDAMVFGPPFACVSMASLEGDLVGHSPSWNEWFKVAETCRTLSKLNGLFIESPSVSKEWNYLPFFETEELMEIGMDGRYNKLYQGIEHGIELGI